MLYLLASWIVLAAVALPVGIAILRWIEATAIDRIGDRVVLALWLGVALLGTLLLAVSLLVALSPAVGAILALALATAAMLVPGVREELRALAARASPGVVAGLAALAAGVALFTAQPVVWSDTGLYHAGAIRWLSEFGAVPGTGLVDLRFGYASSWFALAAPFNPDGLREHGSAVLGGFGLSLVLLQAVIATARAIAGRARRSDWFVIGGTGLAAPILAWDGFHVSASPDLPAAALILVAAWSMLLLAERPASAETSGPLRPGPSVLPLLLGLGALAIKLQAAPLVAVVACYYVLRGGDRLRRAAWAVALGLVAFGPWIAFQVVATGCPAYPVPACLDVSWSVGADTARHASEIVQDYARWLTETSSEGGLGWVGEWLTRQIGDRALALAAASAALLVAGLWGVRRSAGGIARWAALLGAAGLLVFLLRAGNLLMLLLMIASLVPVRRPSAEARWLLAIGLAGVALILYSAPDFRFALGYMAILAGRLVAFWGPLAWERWGHVLAPPVRVPRVGLAPLSAAVGVVAVAALLFHPTNRAEEPIGRIEPLAPPEFEARVLPLPVNGIDYRVPPSGFCRTAELPCTPELDPDVILRDPGAGLTAGFERR